MRHRPIASKTRQFDHLDRERFDMLIIGGGITGAGTARDLALRGMRVALVDQADFASGTSSRSTKLVHGGLRYLEQMAFGLVFESCRERHILRQIAPHLVRPLALMIPLYRGGRRPPWMVRAGLLGYDLLALFRNTHWHQMLSAKQALARQPVLEAEGLRGAALYWDCRMDDARLCLENVLAAREAGAVTVNYARVTALHTHAGRLSGARVRDMESGTEVEVTARLVINAAGPWLDRVAALGGDTQRRLHTTRGSHILVPRISPSAEALYLSAEQDDRLFFVVPWGELSLIGTTDVDAPEVEDDTAASEAEIDYLLTESRRYLPSLKLQRSDVVASFAGLRPLLVHQQSHPSQASREHRIFTSENGLLSIGGGKYTTYRSMAEELADRAMASLGRPRGRHLTARIALPGGATGPLERFETRLQEEFGTRSGLTQASLQRLIARYGARTPHLFSLLDDRPELAEPLGDDLLALEVAYAARFEMARTAEDVLRRRTPLALGGAAQVDPTEIDRLLQQWA